MNECNEGQKTSKSIDNVSGDNYFLEIMYKCQEQKPGSKT